MKCIIRHIPSFLLGVSFVASGWLKGVDPYGTSLKLSEYFRVWGWNGFPSDNPLACSVCLCAGELCLGLLLLSGVFRKAIAWGVVAVMSVFTVLTAWLAFSWMGMSVSDCGCFGDAFTLSHGETLLKNVVLLSLAVGNLWLVRRDAWLYPKGWRTAFCCAVFSFAVPLYSAVWLPPVDFLPFGRGVSLSSVPGFGIYDGRYEEVTDSLLAVSGERPLVAVVSRRGLTADDLHKLSHFLPYYCFRKNYCFVCGDHAADSKDSRYWGFVPEEYIVGVVSEVVSSYDPVTGRERKERRGLNLTDDGEE